MKPTEYLDSLFAKFHRKQKGAHRSGWRMFAQEKDDDGKRIPLMEPRDSKHALVEHTFRGLKCSWTRKLTKSEKKVLRRERTAARVAAP